MGMAEDAQNVVSKFRELGEMVLGAQREVGILKEQNASLRSAAVVSFSSSAEASSALAAHGGGQGQAGANGGGGHGGQQEAALAAERRSLEKSAKNSAQQVLQLELQLVRERETASDLMKKLRDGDRPLKRKVSQLDQNLEQLTVMYHKLVSQNSSLKVECQVAEKKLARKETRNGALEKTIREAKEK